MAQRSLLSVIARLLLVPVGILAGLALLILAITAGAEGFYYFSGRPGDAALLAPKAAVDLSTVSGSLQGIEGLLGPPQGHATSTLADNATYYWWARDAAVQVTALGDTPMYIDFGARKGLHLLPYARPAFPGSFLGLRIGQPAPTPAGAAALQAKAKDCCDAIELSWDVSAGRVTGVHFARAGFFFQYNKR